MFMKLATRAANTQHNPIEKRTLQVVQMTTDVDVSREH